MGLDMYLYGIKSEYGVDDYNIGHEMTAKQIGYWRKVNQVHNWFVEYNQNGVDNCALYTVVPETLEELKTICEEILKNPEKAPELLPTTNGFFFGDTDYDEYYFYGIQETIKICTWALEQDFDYFAYQSSW